VNKFKFIFQFIFKIFRYLLAIY